MEINIEKSTRITDVELWLKVAPPKKGVAQWKDGYSAKEFAKFVIGNTKSFTEIIEEVVNSTVGYVPHSFTGEPEATTDLPPLGSRGPREHDMLLIDKRIVIGIEAKVNEPFGDKTILQESETTSTDKKARIAWLLETILPEGRGLNEKEVGGLQYQLFTATAGTLLEAVRNNKKECIFLVLSFHPENEPINGVNKKSFEDFVKMVCGENQNCKEFKVEGEDIKCWFIERDIAFMPQS